MSIRTFTNRKKEEQKPRWKGIIGSPATVMCDHCKSMWAPGIYRGIELELVCGDGCSICKSDVERSRRRLDETLRMRQHHEH